MRIPDAFVHVPSEPAANDTTVVAAEGAPSQLATHADALCRDLHWLRPEVPLGEFVDQLADSTCKRVRSSLGAVADTGGDVCLFRQLCEERLPLIARVFADVEKETLYRACRSAAEAARDVLSALQAKPRATVEPFAAKASGRLPATEPFVFIHSVSGAMRLYFPPDQFLLDTSVPRPKHRHLPDENATLVLESRGDPPICMSRNGAGQGTWFLAAPSGDAYGVKLIRAHFAGWFDQLARRGPEIRRAFAEARNFAIVAKGVKTVKYELVAHALGVQIARRLNYV